MLILSLCVAVGLLMPFQTAINSRLRRSLGSPFVASFASFAVGTLGLVLVLLALRGPASIGGAFHSAAGAPWWQWIGGILGVILLTMNIFAFSHLGGVETALWPILGSVVSALMIDGFALLGSEYRPFTPMRGLGALVVLLGVSAASGIGTNRGLDVRDVRPRNPLTTWAWRIGAFVAGLGSALQGVVNGRLGLRIGDSLSAALISFLVGTASIGLIAFVASLASRFSADEAVARIDEAGARSGMRETSRGAWRARLRGPAWMWIGGLLGAVFVAMMAYAVPKIGAGPANVASVGGLSLASLAVDRFGLFEAPRKPIGLIQVLGVGLVLLGMMGVQFG